MGLVLFLKRIDKKIGIRIEKVKYYSSHYCRLNDEGSVNYQVHIIIMMMMIMIMIRSTRKANK